RGGRRAHLLRNRPQYRGALAAKLGQVQSRWLSCTRFGRPDTDSRWQTRVPLTPGLEIPSGRMYDPWPTSRRARPPVRPDGSGIGSLNSARLPIARVRQTRTSADRPSNIVG